MSSSTPVTLLPPPDSTPSVLHLSGEAVAPNADGTFTVRAEFLLSLIAGGWRIVVPSGTTHVP